MTEQEREENKPAASEPDKNKDKSQDKDKSKEFRKKALGAAAAVTTGTAVLINGLFGNPDDMIKVQDEANKPAAVYYVEEEDAEEEDAEEEDEEDGPQTLGMRIKRWIWSWPLFLRVLIGLPLWTMGWGVCQAAQLLWKLVLSPVLQVVLSALTLFAALAGAAGLAGRALFPELPLREVFKKSRLIALAIGSAALEVLIALLPVIRKDLGNYAGLIRFGGGALILAGLLLSMWVTKERRRRYVLSLR